MAFSHWLAEKWWVVVIQYMVAVDAEVNWTFSSQSAES